MPCLALIDLYSIDVAEMSNRSSEESVIHTILTTPVRACSIWTGTPNDVTLQALYRIPTSRIIDLEVLLASRNIMSGHTLHCDNEAKAKDADQHVLSLATVAVDRSIYLGSSPAEAAE